MNKVVWLQHSRWTILLTSGKKKMCTIHLRRVWGQLLLRLKSDWLNFSYYWKFNILNISFFHISWRKLFMNHLAVHSPFSICESFWFLSLMRLLIIPRGHQLPTPVRPLVLAELIFIFYLYNLVVAMGTN